MTAGPESVKKVSPTALLPVIEELFHNTCTGLVLFDIYYKLYEEHLYMSQKDTFICCAVSEHEDILCCIECWTTAS